MSDIMGKFKGIPSEKIDDSMEAIFKYEESYMRLLKNYQGEIQMIASMQKQLREEKTAFYKSFSDIEAAMKNDDVLSVEAKQEWLCQYRASMEASFAASEALIEHYVTKNLEEFKQALLEAKGKV